MKFLLKLTNLILISTFSYSCRYSNNLNLENYCDEYSLNCEKKNLTITLITSKGTIKAELFGSTTPLTVANFISNAENGIYEKRNFYKIIDFPDNRILHGGIYSTKNNEYSGKNFNKNNLIPLEIKKINIKEPIYKIQISKPMNLKNIENKFEKGSIAMVKIDNQHSSSTEFFITLNKSPELDGRYSVFGKVIEGYDVLKKIELNDFIKKIEIIN